MHVRADLAERVVAEQPRLDLDAREAVAVDGEARDLLVGEARADRQALEVAASPRSSLLEARAVARLDVDELGELVDGALDVAHLARRDLQRVGRVVAREHDAVAVEDQAAVGHDRHDRDAVVLGLARGSTSCCTTCSQQEARREQAEGDEHGDAGEPMRGAGTGAARARSCGSSAADAVTRSSARSPRRRCGSSSSQVTSGQSSAPSSGATKIGQPGKRRPAARSHQQHHRLRRRAGSARRAASAHRPEPEDARAKAMRAEEREHVGERVLAEQHASLTSIRRPSAKATPRPIGRGCVHAPEHEHERARSRAREAPGRATAGT